MEGGCASCPYMKMNTLASVHHTLDLIAAAGEGDAAAAASLQRQEPEPYAAALANGQSVAARGCLPIVRMQAFQSTGVMPDELVEAACGAQ